MVKKVPMTPYGYKAMLKELTHLLRVERPKIVKEIEIARAHGDLSENAEYQYAKEKQGFIEGKIQEFQGRVALAEVIDPTKLSGNRVAFGATVTLLDLDTDEEMTYSIVGENEANIEKKLISIHSPIVRGIIGREEGDEATVRTPKKTRHLEILEVCYQKISH